MAFPWVLFLLAVQLFAKSTYSYVPPCKDFSRQYKFVLNPPSTEIPALEKFLGTIKSAVILKTPGAKGTMQVVCYAKDWGKIYQYAKSRNFYLRHSLYCTEKGVFSLRRKLRLRRNQLRKMTNNEGLYNASDKETAERQRSIREKKSLEELSGLKHGKIIKTREVGQATQSSIDGPRKLERNRKDLKRSEFKRSGSTTLIPETSTAAGTTVTGAEEVVPSERKSRGITLQRKGRSMDLENRQMLDKCSGTTITFEMSTAATTVTGAEMVPWERKNRGTISDRKGRSVGVKSSARLERNRKDLTRPEFERWDVTSDPGVQETTLVGTTTATPGAQIYDDYSKDDSVHCLTVSTNALRDLADHVYSIFDWVKNLETHDKKW